MKKWIVLVGLLLAANLVSAAETRFTDGPQEYGGRRYYWLAEWRLEVTLPIDVGPGDTLEVLFGTKGPGPRTLYFRSNGTTGKLAERRSKTYEWIKIPLG